MNDYPMISVLTPTYNRSKFLPLYLYNLVSQSYPHNKIEVCIYDDGQDPFCSYEELNELLKSICSKFCSKSDKLKIEIENLSKQ